MPSPSFEFFVDTRLVNVTGITVPAGTTRGGWTLLGSMSSNFGPFCGPCCSSVARIMNPIIQTPLNSQYPQYPTHRLPQQEKVSVRKQEFTKFGEGLPARAEAVLIFGVQISHRAIQIRQ